ncbi:hypothetical protein BDF20DRAFT_904770 [Mycotypha africana]|uniref:uncharacterized protein n=1 Tax=Mycotypha africana TaxID=64632 RepID=UPI0022FFE908|nr:uncharacterized protein BDF20DRAFT_904770 [Mycotypha africana]KAI8987892.1 hypothetical protein BDF20DRAFT_904770 [Mycotypha africana]
MVAFINLLLLGLSQLFIPAFCLYKNQAGKFDWHHTWVGQPEEAVQLDSRHIAVYSHRNVIASLDTETGAVEWRQVLDNEIDHFAATDGGILTVSSNPERAQFWNKTNGQLLWDRPLVSEVYGNTKPITWDNGEVALFIERTKLVKLSNDGEELWTWTRQTNENHIFERMKTIKRDGLIYVIVEPDDEASSPYFVVNKINSDTGATVETFQIPCKSTYDDISYVGDYILWTEEDTINWNPIFKKEIRKTPIKSLVGSLPTADKFIATKLSIIGSTDHQLESFVLLTEYEEEEKYKVASAMINIKDNALSLSKYFGEQNSFGATDVLDQTVIRVMATSANELTVHIMPDDKEIKVAHDFSLTGKIYYVKVINLTPFQMFMVTEGSSVFYYDESSIRWSREEALSSISASEFLELPESKMWTQMADELAETEVEQAEESPFTRYIHRFATHWLELRKLPTWVISHFIGMTSSPSLTEGNDAISTLAAQSCWMNETRPDMVYRDNFGFRKLLISVTRSGKIIAQDTTRKGKVVWSRYVENFSFTHVFVVRSASVKLPPVVVAIAQTYNEFGGPATGFVRVNAFNGEDYVSSNPEVDSFFEPLVATDVGVSKVMLLPVEEAEEHTHLLSIFDDQSGRIYIYPDHEGARRKFVADFLPRFYFTHQDRQGNIQGYKVVEGYRGSLKAEPVWQFVMPENELPVSVSHRQPYEKVASLGRALGNRNVLYKYLNPNMFAMISQNPNKQSIKIRLMDAVKGTVFYEAMHENVDVEKNKVHIIQSENWFVYHFWSNDDNAKGYQAVVLELFEGKDENERIKSDTFSSFDDIQPSVLSAAFAFPYPVTCMGITTTRNGISTKEILFGLPSHQIMGVNKRFLDPRRPRDKPTKEEQEEFLFPYAPIPEDRRLFLTYNLDVAGVKSINTSPSLLESTSLVFAYGLDTFFTRSSPSQQFDVLSEDFSKAQLLLTIAGLAIAIYLTGPMVRRKRVNALWK